jgi:hypothetical protein
MNREGSGAILDLSNPIYVKFFYPLDEVKASQMNKLQAGQFNLSFEFFRHLG